jgi:hypothetical protein
MMKMLVGSIQLLLLAALFSLLAPSVDAGEVKSS